MKSAVYDDLSLHYKLVVASGEADSASLPLVIVLHGRGSDSNDLAELAPLIDGGYRFIFPDAPDAFEPSPGMRYGFTWFDGWPAKRDSIIRSRQLLLTFIAELLVRYPTPEGRIVLSGFSQGGMMSLDVGFRDGPIAGVAVMSGALYEEDMPDFAARQQTPVLIVHGDADDVIPVAAARRTRRVLEDQGLDVEYEEFPMGHQVSEESMRTVARFLRKCLV